MLTLDFDPFPVISTERLILREIGYLDAPVIFTLRSDPRVMTYLDRAPDDSIDRAHVFISRLKESQQNGDGIVWALSLKSDRAMIGTAGFWRIMPEHYRAEVGYTTHPDHQGKGYMQEAMQAILEYGFHKIKLHSVEANVNPDNTASIKLLERNGFVKEAHFRENWYHNGKFLDSAIYSLLKK